MVAAKQDDIPRIVHDLAEAFTQQSKFSNRVWLALVAAATLALFPEVDGSGHVRLPFSLGTVDAGTYKVVGFTILTILIIAFCQAYARAHIAVRFAHALIEELKPERKRLQARILFDNLVGSTFARTSALAELAGRSRLAAIYYLMLKLVANAVIFGIPVCAFFAAYFQLMESASIAAWVRWLAPIGAIVTSVAVLQVLYVELRHSLRVSRLYWSGRLIGKSKHRESGAKLIPARQTSLTLHPPRSLEGRSREARE